MSGDDVNIRDYFERILAENDLRYQQRFDAQEVAVSAAITAQEKAVAAALQAAKEAVAKAEIAAEKRFDSQNEFRGQLADQAREFMPRKEAELQIGALADKVGALSLLVNERSARGVGATQAWGYLIGAVGMLTALATVIIATR